MGKKGHIFIGRTGGRNFLTYKTGLRILFWHDGTQGGETMGEGESCYTFDAAMELAIKMEEVSFRHYLEAIRMVRNKNAREILRGFAIDELEHKHSIERAL